MITWAQELHGRVVPGRRARNVVVAAEDMLDRLEGLGFHPTNPVQIVPPIGDERAQRIVEALLKAPPEVLHGVFGVIHNINVAGPWKQEAGSVDFPWIRVSSKTGVVVVRAGETGWWAVAPREFKAADGLTEAMAKADEALANQGWILVPGFEG